MYKNIKSDGIPDFTLKTKKHNFKILQITDTQIIDSRQCRHRDRLKQNEYDMWLTENKEVCCYRYIRECVERTKPDLIIMTGDNVYGEFDDSGESLVSLCDVMDSFKIPWAPVFGNHDNECKKGVAWQCSVFEASEYCIFRRGDTDGNSNYTIGISSRGKLYRVLYMADTNACFGAEDASVCKSIGLTGRQLEGISETAKALKAKYGKVTPSFLCFHIGTSQYSDAANLSGYQSDNIANNPENYEIGVDVPSKNGDFGYKGEIYGGAYLSFDGWNIIKQAGVDGVFCGHTHNNSTSMLYDGVRLTCGLKTGTYDYHIDDKLGGTLITLAGESFEIEHIYVK